MRYPPRRVTYQDVPSRDLRRHSAGIFSFSVALCAVLIFSPSVSAVEPPGTTLSGDHFPLIEYFHYNSGARDVIYAPVWGGFSNYGILPTSAIGLALPAGTRGPDKVPVYNCKGKVSQKPNDWDYSFPSIDPACAGHPFNNNPSITENFVIYSSQAAGTVPLYRYKLKNEPLYVLSTVPPVVQKDPAVSPDDSHLNVLRYEPDPVHLGYIVEMDKYLDGNQRWINGIGQNLCYGIDAYQNRCDGFPAYNATWQIINLRTGAILYARTLPLGKFSLSAGDISGLITSGQANANMPLLLTVSVNRKVVAAKNVRIIRTPFVAQYDNFVAADDDGRFSNFPTQASAYLLANQMTAHQLFTDPLKARTQDPALYDGIVNQNFFAPNNNGFNFPLDDAANKESYAFKVMDKQGVLVGSEVPYYPYWSLNRKDVVFPFDSAQSVSPTDVVDKAAEWFNTATGQFEKYGTHSTYFVLDYADDSARQWLVAGARPFLDKLYQRNVHPAFVAFSEMNLQAHEQSVYSTFSRRQFIEQTWLEYDQALTPEANAARNRAIAESIYAQLVGHGWLREISPREGRLIRDINEAPPALPGAPRVTYLESFVRAQFPAHAAKILGILQGPEATRNNMRLPYNQSPTFSEEAYQDFSQWLRLVNAPASYVALPVLPEDYVRARDSNNPNLGRIQSAPAPAGTGQPGDLWWYWSIWRRAIFTRSLDELAKELKNYHATQSYARAPLALIMYHYPGWFSINGNKFDPLTDGYWEYGYFYDAADAANSTLFVDPGMDYWYSQNDTRNSGAFDYYVSEVKSVLDSTAITLAGKMTSFKTPSPPASPWAVPPKIGLHVEVEWPFWWNKLDWWNPPEPEPADPPPAGSTNLPSNYMNTNMSQVFPGAGADKFRAPAFDMVWAWEAQCEYIMSMKPTLDPGHERIDVQIVDGSYVVNNAGGYAGLASEYAKTTGAYCLWRHQHVNLTQYCADAACATRRDRIPQIVMRNNMNRLLTWKKNYLDGQEVPRTDSANPSAPASLTAGSISGTSASLTWTVSTDNIGVSHYLVYRDGFVIATSPGNSFTDALLTPATTYKYKVAAVGTAGNISPPSNEVTVNTRDTIPPTGTVTVNNGATVTKLMSVTLRLLAQDVGSGVSQMRFSNDMTTWSAPVNYATTAAWTLPSGDGTKMVYAKFADVAGNWMVNPVWDAITLDTTAPTAPAGLTVVDVSTSGSSRFWLRWSPSTDSVGVLRYDIYRNGAYIASVHHSVLSYQDGSTTSGATYTYTVKALDTAGNTSSPSNGVTVLSRKIPIVESFEMLREKK